MMTGLELGHKHFLNFWTNRKKNSLRKLNNLGKKMCLNNRTVQHQDLHPKTAVQEELFHTSTSLDWQPMTDHSRGMHSVS